MLKLFRHIILSSLMLLLLAPAVRAGLTTDLQNLNLQASTLNSDLASLQLNADSVCGPLLDASNRARELLNSLTLIDESLVAPLSVDADVYNALDQLFATSLSLSNELLSLSTDISTLAGVMDAITLKDGITAMLQLSDDIGSMADRIGEMADKILVMSDNIGVMADRILQTQTLQSQNLALTTQSILQTQQNMLSLVSVVETASYDITYDQLYQDGMLLAARMASTAFHPWTMDDQLRLIAADVELLLQQVTTANDALLLDTANSNVYITSDTLIKLANLPLMMNALTTAVDGYVITIQGLQPLTSDPTLYDAMKSMLTLSADIGTMANRILEMGDQILAMADNIGLQADQIIATQAAMNGNIALSQASILAAQEFAIGVIATTSIN